MYDWTDYTSLAELEKQLSLKVENIHNNIVDYSLLTQEIESIKLAIEVFKEKDV